MKNKKLRPWCYHPFTNLTIESGGKLRMCCASMTHTVGEVNEISNIEDFWLNSPEMDVIRTDMLDHNLEKDCPLITLEQSINYIKIAEQVLNY